MNKAIQDIQAILGVEMDGIWGTKSQAALDALIHPAFNSVKISSFADQRDLEAFARCKREGGYWANGRFHTGSSDRHCFEIGDNGIGYWGDATVKGSGPSCAIKAGTIVAKFGTLDDGHLKQVRIKIHGREVVALVKDILGTDGRIDLNPDACEALGFTPPVLESGASWEWVV